MEVVKTVSKSIAQQAREELFKEKADKARKRLVDIMRRLDAAKQVVANVQRELDLAEAEIEADAAI